MPFFPPLALYFGLGMQPLLNWEQWNLTTRRRRNGAVAATATFVGSVTAAGVKLLLLSPVFLMYRPNNLNTALIDGARAIEDATPKGSLLVVVEYAQWGADLLMLLYYSHRRGWSFDASAIRPMVIEYLRDRKGADAPFFATSGWHRSSRSSPTPGDISLRPSGKLICLTFIRGTGSSISVATPVLSVPK